MRFVEDSIEYVPQESGLVGMYKQIEKAARICYKTEDYTTDDSYDRIINKILIPRGHTSCLEFGTIYLHDIFRKYDKPHWVEKYKKDRFSRVKIVEGKSYNEVFITTTYRTILQGDYDDPIDAIKNNFDKDWKEDLKYWSELKPEHYKRYCYKFVMDRVGSQSVMRHRGRFGISYAQESTRYINYNRDKFDNQITCVYPSKFYDLINKWSVCEDGLTGEKYIWLKDSTLEEQLIFLRTHDRGWCAYEEHLDDSSRDYMYLTSDECGWKPEDARGVLPLDVKTEFMMCAYPEDWNMWLFRRCDKHAHPHIQKFANMVKEDLQSRL